jgi:hypothetical protein
MRLHGIHRIGRVKSMAGVRHPGEVMFDAAIKHGAAVVG